MSYRFYLACALSLASIDNVLGSAAQEESANPTHIVSPPYNSSATLKVSFSYSAENPVTFNIEDLVAGSAVVPAQAKAQALYFPMPDKAPGQCMSGKGVLFDPGSRDHAYRLFKLDDFIQRCDAPVKFYTSALLVRQNTMVAGDTTIVFIPACNSYWKEVVITAIDPKLPMGLIGAFPLYIQEPEDSLFAHCPSFNKTGLVPLQGGFSCSAAEQKCKIFSIPECTFTATNARITFVRKAPAADGHIVLLEATD